MRSIHSCRRSETHSDSKASLWMRMNSSGLPPAQGGSSTSASHFPSCSRRGNSKVPAFERHQAAAATNTDGQWHNCWPSANPAVKATSSGVIEQPCLQGLLAPSCCQSRARLCVRRCKQDSLCQSRGRKVSLQAQHPRTCRSPLSRAVKENKLSWAGWQLPRHTFNSDPPTHLPQPQPELVAVEQKLRLAEPLRSELLCVAAVVQAIVPGGGHAMEQAIRMVKAPALQLPAQARERLHAYEVEQGGACRAQVFVLATVQHGSMCSS